MHVSGEMLGAQIASLHNLHFYLDLVRQVRERIKEGRFSPWAKAVVERIEEGERE
jgi:queuine tRNA-ribosyltransferase